MLILPGEATIRLSGDASCNSIQCKKHVPLGLMSLRDNAGNYGLGYIMDEPEMSNQTWWRVQCFKETHYLSG